MTRRIQRPTRTTNTWVNGILFGFITVGWGLLVSFGTQLQAKGKPPRDPGESGVIYYYSGGDYYAMASDGSNKHVVLSDVLFGAEPSEVLHGGERWFLTFVEIPGELYPDGGPRHELAARSESGLLVQLSDDPSLEFFSQGDLEFAAPRWSLADTRVSFVARRWGVDATGAAAVVNGGIYAIDLDADVAAGPTIAVPDEVLVGFPLVDAGSSGPYPDINGYDWSPDGTWITFSRNGLWVADLVTGAVDLIVTEVSTTGQPRWSINDEILFGQWEIYKANPDGTGLTTIVESGRFTATGKGKGPHYGLWSPTGANVVFEEWAYASREILPERIDVFRVAADGRDETNLTQDVDEHTHAVGWRAE